jgi:hypothetical protein
LARGIPIIKVASSPQECGDNYSKNRPLLRGQTIPQRTDYYLEDRPLLKKQIITQGTDHYLEDRPLLRGPFTHTGAK